MRMSFDRNEWVDDMVTQAVGGAVAGMVGASMVPRPALGFAAIAGALSGLAFGIVALPVKAILGRWRDRRRLEEKESGS